MKDRRITSDNSATRVSADKLRDFCVRVFEILDVSTTDAEITANVLLAASLRGIDSHGVARTRRYVKGLQNGAMLARPEEKTISETTATALVDAGGGLGQPVSYRSMKRAIEKAKEQGIGCVTVRNSNHYGIAGYYAMLALEHDMIGISLTNANVSVVPTFGLNPMIGTNPIAVAAPAGQELPFVLDMATSIVAVGKLVVAHNLGKPIPEGWAIDEMGSLTSDPGRVLENRAKGQSGGVLPLGGVGEILGGHKGYGLALLVEILSAILPGAAHLDKTYPRTPKGKPMPADLGHFFAAIRVDAFRPLDEFKATMDDTIRRLKVSPKAQDSSRVFIAGEKEYEEIRRRATWGIPLEPHVVADLKAIARELDITLEVGGV